MGPPPGNGGLHSLFVRISHKTVDYFLYFVILYLFLVLLLGVVDKSWAYIQHRIQVSSLHRQIRQTEASIQSLSNRIQQEEKTEWVENRARERYGYAYPGERLYKNPSFPAEEGKKSEKGKNPFQVLREAWQALKSLLSF